RTYWVSPRKLEVIGWGVAPPGPAPPASDRGVLTILCVGRLGRHKGQEWLLKVYRQARPEFLCRTRLVLVGRDEDGGGVIRSQVQAFGLEQEVTVTGEVSDEELAEWYSRSDLFTLFSRYEAFGLSFFEAMAWGVPVLTHDVGANRELLARGSVVVPRFDGAAAVGELVRLVNDNEYRQRLGREGREYALAGFTWSAVAEKYLRVYQGSS
ncbi:MAG: glycosyltransferase family 4 protein, partial [Chloroflexota bacterium]